MSRRGLNRSWLAVVAAIFLIPLLAGCGTSSGKDKKDAVAWAPATSPPQVASTVAATEAPALETPAPTAVPTVDPGTGAETDASTPDIASLTPEELLQYQPNELAYIPVLEYHVITTDESRESDHFVRTADHMRQDLQWLYDHDFYVITTRQMLENRITAPAGKRPVVLTFDDASASQFRWEDGGNGVRAIDPDTAIGVLEAFFAAHPDFGRGGQFAVLPFNCFSDGTPLNTLDDCPDKLRWMADNGYEIANHTAGHQDMYDITDENFAFQIGDPIIWLDSIIQGDANLMDVVVMPFGNYPSKDLHPEQRRMLRKGFTYQGRDIQVQAAMMVGANPTESPSSTEYDPIFIARIQMFQASVDEWFGWWEDGSHLVYISDGNPDTITIPDPVPDQIAAQFDPEFITADGHELVQYDPDTGAIVQDPGTQ